jgi:CDP-glucose 4,6-dehydratase
MENLGLNPDFWRDRSVFLTGHTGFKGGWLALWLSQLGAKVHGYSLTPPTDPSFFNETNLCEYLCSSVTADIRDLSALQAAMKRSEPSIIFHMAAMSLVRESYEWPVSTFTTNVVGTINVLEAARATDGVAAIVNVTSDKCYENEESLAPYLEGDRLGGHDPYSSSKACAELASAAYRSSFLAHVGIQLANVRAGNVIGGGDWQRDRLIPDALRAFDAREILRVRAPHAVRPWQHVLDPLSGYLTLAAKLVSPGSEYADAWNFGPRAADSKQVRWVVDRLCHKFPAAHWKVDKSPHPHEAELLNIDSSKARRKLGWVPRWSIETALDMTVEWHRGWRERLSMDELSIQQIEAYVAA